MEFKPPFAGRRKIPETRRELARALLEAGKTYREVAEALDMSVGSVHNVMKEPPERTAPLLSALKSRFAMKHLMISDHILGRISDTDIMQASLRDKVIAAAILADKARLLEGEGRIEQVEQPEQGEEPERIETEGENAGGGAIE
jgi:hypothetical protein